MNSPPSSDCVPVFVDPHEEATIEIQHQTCDEIGAQRLRELLLEETSSPTTTSLSFLLTKG